MPEVEDTASPSTSAVQRTVASWPSTAISSILALRAMASAVSAGPPWARTVASASSQVFAMMPWVATLASSFAVASGVL
jgi:hypothetical protein